MSDTIEMAGLKWRGGENFYLSDMGEGWKLFVQKPNGIATWQGVISFGCDCSEITLTVGNDTKEEAAADLIKEVRELFTDALDALPKETP